VTVDGLSRQSGGLGDLPRADLRGRAEQALDELAEPGAAEPHNVNIIACKRQHPRGIVNIGRRAEFLQAGKSLKPIRDV
jgi:hypothetical protein